MKSFALEYFVAKNTNFYGHADIKNSFLQENPSGASDESKLSWAMGCGGVPQAPYLLVGGLFHTTKCSSHAGVVWAE